MAPDTSNSTASKHTNQELVDGQFPEFMTLHEIAKKAHKKLSLGAWDYLMGASETETTLRRNRLAIDRIALKPRVLRNVSQADLSCDFLGEKIRMPVMLAPIGGIEAFDPEGGAASARASGAFGVPHMLSSQCSPGLEETAAAADNFRIFQLYVRCDQKETDDYVKRARDNGYRAFCMTIDSAHYSRRERDLAKRYQKKWRDRHATQGLNFQKALSWDEVKHYKDTFPDFPLILKGFATAEDAAIALEHGVEGIYISNHGGRQLDHGRGSMDVLPEIVKVAKGKATIIVDGGFMRGTDVVKAKAIGADIVGIGRLQGLALSAGGEATLVRALDILEREVNNCLALSGVTSFDEVDDSLVCYDNLPVAQPHVLSAFPLLDLADEGY